MAANGGGGTGKFTTWEGGHHEAAIAHWPAGIASPGRTSAAILHIVDILPTFAALAGVTLPSDRHYDGVDFGAVLKGTTDSVARDFLFHQSDATFTAARHGRYKAHWETVRGKRMVFLLRAQNLALTFTRKQLSHAKQWSAEGCNEKGTPHVKHSPPLIFDLLVDPGESTPVTVPGLADAFDAALAALLSDVEGSFKTQSDYSGGGRAFWPCCNATNPACACDAPSVLD